MTIPPISDYSSKVATPEISVVMSIYNEVPQYLNKALLSLSNQSFENFEIVLIDDGSDLEGCLDIINYWSIHDQRIRVFRKNNQGLTKSLNLGIIYARGKWIARHDSDDWSDPVRFARQLAMTNCSPEIGVVGSWFYSVDRNGQIQSLHRMISKDEEVRRTIAKKNPFCHGAMMFRRDHALAIGGYREFLRAGQDYDFFWRLIDLKCKFAAVEEPLYYLRNTPSGISADKGYLQKEAAWITRKLAEKRKQSFDEMGFLDEILSLTKSPALQREFRYTGNLLSAHKVFESGCRAKGLMMILNTLIKRPHSLMAYEYLARKVSKLLLSRILRGKDVTSW